MSQTVSSLAGTRFRMAAWASKASSSDAAVAPTRQDPFGLRGCRISPEDPRSRSSVLPVGSILPGDEPRAPRQNQHRQQRSRAVLRPDPLKQEPRVALPGVTRRPNQLVGQIKAPAVRPRADISTEPGHRPKSVDSLGHHRRRRCDIGRPALVLRRSFRLQDTIDRRPRDRQVHGPARAPSFCTRESSDGRCCTHSLDNQLTSCSATESM
jgi:hypothetical protein